MKQYKEMTAEEQLRFVTDFTIFEKEKMPVLTALGDTGWTDSNRADMEHGLRMIGAFSFGARFVADAFRYGDYSRRTYRLPFYARLVKKELANDVALRGGDGRAFVYAPAMQQQFRRRGRPTKEETAMYAAAAKANAAADIETRKQQAIAALLGIEIVTNQTLREKNNAELAAERAEREAKAAKQSPSLFEGVAQDNLESDDAGSDVSPQTIETISQARLHLDQLRFLLSPTLQERVDTVRELRQRAAFAAETAKQMAEKGEKPEDVKPYAQEAATATEQYEAIYDDVDNELAAVYYRLKHDGDYTKKFCERYQVRDTSVILKQLRPYFDKVKSPEFELRMKSIIEQESPEYVARMKAEKEKKAEIDAILKYLRRKDKEPTKQRLETARKRYGRLVELMGEENASPYLPLVQTIERVYKDRQKRNAE